MGHLDRDKAIEIIKTALKRRTGRAFSVVGSRGTAWAWIEVNSLPARRVNGNPCAEDLKAIAACFGRDSVHFQGLTISPEERTEMTAAVEGVSVEELLARPGVSESSPSKVAYTTELATGDEAFDVLLAAYVKRVQGVVDAYYAKAFPNSEVPQIKADPRGKKYVRLVGKNGVFGFVEKATGNVFKAASPGQGHPRQHPRDRQGRSRTLRYRLTAGRMFSLVA